MATTDDIPGPFYHGTKADLRPGDLISPGYRSNYGDTVRTSPWVYMTALMSPLGAELAQGDGPGRLYIVEPTGPFFDDPDLTDKKFPGNPTQSYRSRSPLRVVGEVTGWEPHPPEQLQAMREGQARLYAQQAERISRIPTGPELAASRAEADERARRWTAAPRYLGCMVLMRFRGTETEVFSAFSYTSESGDETLEFELPVPVDSERDRPDDLPMSGRIEEVSAWRDGWTAVIESCVTEIGLSLETRLWAVADAEHDTMLFRLDADGPERSWRRDLQLVGGVLIDMEHGEIWDFSASPSKDPHQGE